MKTSRIAAALQARSIRREAKRRLRALQREGRGPWVRVELALRGTEWDGARGTTSVKSTVRLDRDAARMTRRDLSSIRGACLRSLEADVRRERTTTEKENA